MFSDTYDLSFVVTAASALLPHVCGTLDGQFPGLDRSGPEMKSVQASLDNREIRMETGRRIVPGPDIEFGRLLNPLLGLRIPVLELLFA